MILQDEGKAATHPYIVGAFLLLHTILYTDVLDKKNCEEDEYVRRAATESWC